MAGPPTWLLIDAGLCLQVYAASDHLEISVALVIVSLQGALQPSHARE